MKPTARVYQSEIDGHWVVDIYDAPADVRIYLNDGFEPVFGKDVPYFESGYAREVRN